VVTKCKSVVKTLKTVVKNKQFIREANVQNQHGRPSRGQTIRRPLPGPA
jgi:hypothetical protein